MFHTLDVLMRADEKRSESVWVLARKGPQAGVDHATDGKSSRWGRSLGRGSWRRARGQRLGE